MTTRSKKDDDAAAEVETSPPPKKADAAAKAREQLDRGEISWRDYLTAVNDAGT